MTCLTGICRNEARYVMPPQQAVRAQQIVQDLIFSRTIKRAERIVKDDGITVRIYCASQSLYVIRTDLDILRSQLTTRCRCPPDRFMPQ